MIITFLILFFNVETLVYKIFVFDILVWYYY
jgi:hypothetical protein